MSIDKLEEGATEVYPKQFKRERAKAPAPSAAEALLNKLDEKKAAPKKKSAGGIKGYVMLATVPNKSQGDRVFLVLQQVGLRLQQFQRQIILTLTLILMHRLMISKAQLMKMMISLMRDSRPTKKGNISFAKRMGVFKQSAMEG